MSNPVDLNFLIQPGVLLISVAQFCIRIMLMHLKLLNGLWAIPAVIVIWLLRPLILIKMQVFRSEHIGGLVPKSSNFLRHYKKQKGVIELYGVTGKNNTFWVQLIKRSGLPMYGAWLQYLWYWVNLLPDAEIHKIPYESRYLYDESNWNFEYAEIMPFKENENEKGEEWLRNHGWHVGQPYVCIIVRDAAFMDHLAPPTSKNNWDYHSYRDSDINTYTEGIMWLLDKGYFVIRMGRKMLSPMPFTDKNLVDYPFCNEKSDFLDVWLFANCTYSISTGTGPDLIAGIYNKPVLFINALPFNAIPLVLLRQTWVPKKLFKLDTGAPLTIEEYFPTQDYYSTETYSLNNILIKDLEPAEILEYIIEFDSGFRCDFKMDENNQLRQEHAWLKFFSFGENYKLKKLKHPKATFSQLWINKFG